MSPTLISYSTINFLIEYIPADKKGIKYNP
jgi:hypothetical protein